MQAYWDKILKAEYLFRPQQAFFRSLQLILGEQSESQKEVPLPWGHKILVNPKETIGKAIANLGLYELVPSEVMARLVDPGETVADIGANIGYTTSLLARAVGSEGLVVSFEPLPKNFAVLEQNASTWAIADNTGRIELLRSAVSDVVGETKLFVPASIIDNSGLSSLIPQQGDTIITCRTVTLDNFFVQRKPPSLIKIDVEGAELKVLQGAKRLIESGVIRDIIFEDHSGETSPVRTYLERLGYRVFGLKRTLMRPVLVEPKRFTASTWEPPSFVATKSVDRLLERLRQGGWKVLWFNT